MATLYQWIVTDLSNKTKTDSPAEIRRWAETYQRNLGIDPKKLVEAAYAAAAQ